MKIKLFFKTGLILAGLLIQDQAHSQAGMYVSNNINTYVYVYDRQIYIGGALELNGGANSRFLLRREAQLFQGNAASNLGLGSLSVYQEGTVNNFRYNYWCSPIGVPAAGAGNANFGVTLLGTPTTTFNTTAATIPPTVSNLDGVSSVGGLHIASDWIYRFSVQDLYADWIFVGPASTIPPGAGFTMKGVSGSDATNVGEIAVNNAGDAQRYDFRGKPNNGTILIPVLNAELTLTGNPYPSAIDLDAFLTANAASCNQIAQFWEDARTANSHFLNAYRGGYGTYSAVTNIYVPAAFYSYDNAGLQLAFISNGGARDRLFSPIGQGFFIEGIVAGNVTMNNTYRIYKKESIAGDFSDFEKSSGTKKKTTAAATTVPLVSFNTLLNNELVRQSVIAFDPNTTSGKDNGWDAELFDVDLPANFYFVIDGKKYVMEGVPFDTDGKIAIGFSNAAEANYKIAVSEVLNLSGVSNVYLHDKLTNEYHNIKTAFHDMTLPAGTNDTQYEITFKNGISEVAGTTSDETSLVQQDNVSKQMTLHNPQQLDILKYSLYDVQGRLIRSEENLGKDASYSFSTSSLANGVYIVKVVTSDNVETATKVIVTN